MLDAYAYDSVWVWDHYVSWNDPHEPVLECWTTLAGLAEATSRIRLGPLVANNTNRHPGRLAKVAATLSDLTGGRLDLGIGAGGRADEQASFGIAQGDRAERTARLAEALQIIPALWSGQPVTFNGRFYQLDGAICAPAPNPRPRIVVGARSPELAALAGRYAGGLNLQWRDRAKLSTVLGGLDAGLAERGRDRAGFDLSLLADWGDLLRDPPAALAGWQALGFDRVVLAVSAPFPLAEFAEVSRRWLGSGH
jgi:alkanesulfonate monooxygenase SsuD/methylene tetrahydromethanopterin reductase-like flavin-dependent oxidoreductase (luciferase family)